jgi:probable rRNA maturation factor
MKKAPPVRIRASAPKTLAHWNPIAERRLGAVLKAARAEKGLAKLGVYGDAPRWGADVRLVGLATMTRLNGRFRGKRYATDVLSFPAPEVFQRSGWLGELVICLPVLIRQGREHGHSPNRELQILLIHGVLHLLGLDHEKGRKDAATMARWESRLLNARSKGLIERAG